MMKMNKSTHKISRNSRGSPVRKEHLMKKTMHPNASMRTSNTSSRPMLKRLSPGMKRGPILPPSKGVHSSRVRSIASPPPHRSVTRHSMQQSPVSMDRGIKRLKYDKRKMSPSPTRHPMSPSSAPMRGPSPYRNNDRYLNVRPVASHPPHYSSPPPKKKNRREVDKFDHGGSNTMLRRPDIPQHSEGRMVQRNDMPSSRPMASMSVPLRGHITSIHNERTPHFDNRGRGRGGPTSISSHSKRPPPTIKPSYQNTHHNSDRYQSPPPSNTRYSDSEKHYAPPTLHERFSSVVETNRTEPRIKYSREDLEKITIDIHRNLKAESPTVRRIVNPNDVKLVRRANEGHRPMFDREEIKQAPRDMRDEAHYEKNVHKIGGGYGSGHSVGHRGEHENYEITRSRFDPHHQTFHSTSGRSLSERWQNADARKDGAPMDRDDRESEYERQPMKRSFNDSRTSKAGDRDFRSERFSGPSTSHGRPEYSPTHHILPPPLEPRNSSSIHRKTIAPMDARRKLSVRRGSDRGPPPNVRSESKNRYAPVDKRYPDSMSSRIEKPIDRRSPIMEPPVWKRKSRSVSREKMPSFSSRRPDKYSYKSLPDKSDGPSKISNYYEDNRESSDSYRGRGSRPFRGGSRGFRSRGGIRGSTRGSFPSRSTFRGGFRGRGAPRRGRISPMWEHDMYSRTDDNKRVDYP